MSGHYPELHAATRRAREACARADMAEAIERSNQWVDAARPIIRAMFALEDIDLSAVEGSITWGEAQSYVSDAFKGLHSMLDGIRDDFLCDERRDWNPLMGDREAEAVDVFNDDLDAAVITVAQAVKMEASR